MKQSADRNPQNGHRSVTKVSCYRSSLFDQEPALCVNPKLHQSTPSPALLQPASTPKPIDPLSCTQRRGLLDGSSKGKEFLAVDRGVSVSSAQTESKRAGFTSLSEVLQSLPVHSQKRHLHETRMNPGRKQRHSVVHGDDEIKAMKRREPCFEGFTDNL